jgi:hypothetical protein
MNIFSPPGGIRDRAWVFACVSSGRVRERMSGGNKINDGVRGDSDEVVDAGRLDVRSLCLRFVEVLACSDGQRARYSCECGGDGCPLDPRPYAAARAAAERDLRLTLELERTTRLGEGVGGG